jgi:NADPH:quinone reductase-like Zn-dependent oxidoreductase
MAQTIFSDSRSIILKAMMLKSPTGPDGLELVDVADPVAGPGEVLVRMRAASINYRDCLIINGGYRRQQKQQNLIPLSDGAGDVVAIGDGVDEFQVGERVIAMFCQDWVSGEPDQETIESHYGRDLDGMLCELKVFKSHQLVKTPDYLNDAEAAALPCAGLTAWSAVVTEGKAKPGDLVLTQGTGGVSLFAVQFAKVAGAKVIVTSSSDDKLKRAKEMGADEMINYRSDKNWGKAALAMSEGVGIDNVIELGGTQTLKQSLISVRPGGTISMIGVLSGATFGDALLPFVVSRKVRMQGITVGSRDHMGDMLQAMESHAIHPVIDEIFAFKNAGDAFRHVQSGAHFGKVCISI